MGVSEITGGGANKRPSDYVLKSSVKTIGVRNMLI